MRSRGVLQDAPSTIYNLQVQGAAVNHYSLTHLGDAVRFNQSAGGLTFGLIPAHKFGDDRVKVIDMARLS